MGILGFGRRLRSNLPMNYECDLCGRRATLFYRVDYGTDRSDLYLARCLHHPNKSDLIPVYVYTLISKDEYIVGWLMTQ
jgi:hypothetical protein